MRGGARTRLTAQKRPQRLGNISWQAAHKQNHPAVKNLLVEAEKEAKDIFRDIEPPYIWKKYLLDNKEKLEEKLPDTVYQSRNSLIEFINKDINNNYKLLARGLQKDFFQEILKKYNDAYPHVIHEKATELIDPISMRCLGQYNLEESSKIACYARFAEELENKYYKLEYLFIKNKQQTYINKYMHEKLPMAMKKYKEEHEQMMKELKNRNNYNIFGSIINKKTKQNINNEELAALFSQNSKRNIFALNPNANEYIPRNTLRNNLKKATNSKLTANNLMGGKRTRKNRKNKKHL